MKRVRPTWQQYFMNIAEIVATRTTCDRAHVGALIVRNKRILSTGYNGSPAGAPHCDDVGHELVEGHCVRTIHAEVNAIAQAAKNGVNIEGSEIYVTFFPCYNCFKLLANVGIKTIYYKNLYYKPGAYKESAQMDETIKGMANKLQITITKVE